MAEQELTILGRATETPASPDAATIERVANPHADAPYLVRFTAPEFTSICPKTGQPDFATMEIRYVAGARCIELKSLKLYLQSYRDQGIYYEDVTNLILDDLVAACEPKWMIVESTWSVRGGIHSVITARHGRPEPDLAGQA